MEERSPWLAIGATADRTAHARALRRVHDAFHAGRDVRSHVRAVVERSWARSGAAGIDPDGHLPPIVVDEAAIADRWEDHPLYQVLPVLRDLLSGATSESGHMLVISDARGVLLWMEGHRRVIEATEDMHFVCGADWSESGAGTNALGTAIAVDHPVQIFSAEHYTKSVHPWQCSGAPIHDPRTGEIIGVIDLTGHYRTAHPHTLSLVTAAAGMAEAYLRQDLERSYARLRERYHGRVAGSGRTSALVLADGTVLDGAWLGARIASVPVAGGDLVLPDGRAAVAEPLDGEALVIWPATPSRPRPRPPGQTLRLELLTPRPQATLGELRVGLGPRQAEILALLMLHPAGLSGEQLALELYGERGKPVTVRAEMTRLKRVLGPIVSGRPYRLAVTVESDVLEVERRLRAGDADGALALHRAPLLRTSEVPRLVETRRALEADVRTAVLASDSAGLLDAWCRSPSGTGDLEAAERMVAVTGPSHPLAGRARARLAAAEPAAW